VVDTAAWYIRDVRLIDEGENFRLAVWRGVAFCQVWRRPDVSDVEGTRFAAVLMNSLRALLTSRDHDVPGIVFDVREAPTISGPKTIALLSEAVETWALAEKRVAVLVGAVEQRDQMRTLLDASAHGRGSVTDDVDAAVAFASELA
jgi:hypothetical protein